MTTLAINRHPCGGNRAIQLPVGSTAGPKWTPNGPGGGSGSRSPGEDQEFVAVAPARPFCVEVAEAGSFKVRQQLGVECASRGGTVGQNGAFSDPQSQQASRREDVEDVGQ